MAVRCEGVAQVPSEMHHFHSAHLGQFTGHWNIGSPSAAKCLGADERLYFAQRIQGAPND
jgi:hypothetical protein